MKQSIHIKNNNKARNGKFRQSVVLLMVACLMCACSNESEYAEPAGMLSLSVQGVYNYGGEAVATRAAATTTVTSGSIGVFRKEDPYYTPGSADVKYTYASGKWTRAADATDSIPLGAQDCRASLYAYYPNNGTISVGADNAVALDARAYDADYDFCYCPLGSATATAGSAVYNYRPEVTFAMKRAYTQLAVKLTRGAGYRGDGNITAISVEVAETGQYYSTGTQDISTGTYTPGTAGIKEITYAIPAGTKLAKTNDVLQLGYLLPPGKNGTIEHLILSITADGVTTKTKIDVATAAMEAGKCYVLRALLNYDALAGGIEVSDEWDSQTPFNEEPEFIKP